MKKAIRLTTMIVMCINLLTVSVFGKELVAVGQVVGLELQDGTVTVAAIDEVLGKGAREAGLEVGDRLISVNDNPISCAQDVCRALQTSQGCARIKLQRGVRQIDCKVTPQITPEGPKLGIYLKHGVTGIGTVTWYDPETGKFGTLGHGVNDPSGQLLQLKQGNAYNTRVAAVRKGRAGEPGQLMGCTDVQSVIGTLYANRPQGVFGKTEEGFSGKKLETATWDSVKTGSATILATVSGNAVQEYSVEILKIYPKANASGRNLLLRVTDPRLLEITGGIVQGMSGSPIIQEGKLVGAVTHVLVNDPTTGYGIFIENMLDAAA